MCVGDRGFGGLLVSYYQREDPEGIRILSTPKLSQIDTVIFSAKYEKSRSP